MPDTLPIDQRVRDLDPIACHRAVRARDARFDGRLFVGITSTGIYCRPVCPARAARFENCRFFATAAAAQEASFRPCLRCRPETAPDAGAWRGTSNTVARGLALIAEGGLDGEDASVEGIAERLGVGERQLRRLFQQHLGASPIAVAQTRRVLFAKQLLHETRLPMTDVALAAGFGSVRRFNETFQRLFHRPPSALRSKTGPPTRAGASTLVAAGVTVRLRYRSPFDWAALVAHLEKRAIDGVEQVKDGVYRRTIRHDGATGLLTVAHVPAASSLAATVTLPDVHGLAAVVTRIRRMFDVDADVGIIGAHLARDPLLAPRIASRPGLRVPGGWDGFELAVRAVLGQQVTVQAARRLAGQLVRICGATSSAEPDLPLAFPSPAEVARVDLGALGMPRARQRTLDAIARAALDDASLFARGDSVEATVSRLRALPGVGEWTAQYIALRAAREPDAFPASDVGLLRGAARGGVRPSPQELLARAERWRPWRAYAAQHLWTHDATLDTPAENDP
jgi:AraC family transcriptional regulator of adaptative response / DNA-3-methyladenine glycosylase II